MRVALVHYWLTTIRGGEKVLESFCRMYPQADIFTHVLDEKCLSPVLRRHRIQTSFIQRLPCSRKHYQKYLPLMPLALEHLDLTEYDLVISSESGPAKGIITRADTLHVCYCHSPMRYLWDHYPFYYAGAGCLSRAAMRLFFPLLRMWDVTSAQRVDAFIANSQTVAARIHKHWRREASIVHPPVAVDNFTAHDKEKGEYYLYMGQLVRYKRADLAIEACMRMKRPVVIVGEGEERKKLEAMADSSIRFVGRQDDLGALFRNCRALLFPGEEDFGIVPVEAMAAGVPVIAYGKGGATETVRDGQTGLFFKEATVASLMEAMERFERQEDSFDPLALRAHAEHFGEERFQQEAAAVIRRAWEEHQKYTQAPEER